MTAIEAREKLIKSIDANAACLHEKQQLQLIALDAARTDYMNSDLCKDHIKRIDQMIEDAIVKHQKGQVTADFGTDYDQCGSEFVDIFDTVTFPVLQSYYENLGYTVVADHIGSAMTICWTNSLETPRKLDKL